MLEAVEVLKRHKISELPVVDEAGRPVGLVDVTDLLGVLPAEMEAEDHAPAWHRESA